MRTRRPAGGFTLVDATLLAALAVLVLLAWWPGHVVRDVLRREDVAMDTLREIGERLDARRAAAQIDTDGDGRGETPPIGDVAAAADGFRPGADGAASERDGYWFTVLVPGADRLPRRVGTAEASTDGSEATYVLIAWPVDPGKSGMRAYVRTPLDGLLRHGIDGYPYGGPDAPPAPRHVLVERRTGMLQPVPLRDGEVWVPPRETVRSR